MHIQRKLFRLASILWCVSLLCILLGLSKQVYGAEDFLEPQQAFQFHAEQVGSNKVSVTYTITSGYYMYRDRFTLQAKGAVLGEPLFPKGKIKFDENFQKNVETFRQKVVIEVPILSVDALEKNWTLSVLSQGCSDKGLCYVPMESTQTFRTENFQTKGVAGQSDISHDSRLQTWLRSENYWMIVPIFMLLGLGLAFTPCVLPMVPILSSIILGEGGVTKKRGFFLSLSYSLGMAVVYTMMGVMAGLLGEGLSAMLQKPWVITLFALLLVIFALSMFNVYHLQLPSSLQVKLSHVSQRQAAGKWLGVFVMGAVSALIIGPCVAAPLASVLLYISQTQHVVVGGVALFSMAMGMSVPLLLVGISAGMFLPRVGHWTEYVKQFFGVLMLGLAWWMVSPLLVSWLVMLGWALLLLGYGLFLMRRNKTMIMKFVALIVGLLGVIELVGVVTGGQHMRTPLAYFVHPSNEGALSFLRIRSVAELDTELVQFQASNAIILLDFYADWCVACKEMEKFTFTDEAVKRELAGMVRLQVDVTDNTPDDKHLLKKFHLYGPPGMIFLNGSGQEIGRVVGFEHAKRFLASVQEIKNKVSTINH